MKLPNSISEIYYFDKTIFYIIAATLVLGLFIEGTLLQLDWVIASGFFAFLTLIMVSMYKESKKIGYIHYFGAISLFTPLVFYAGLWSLVIPVVISAYLYVKHNHLNIHYLVLEVLLFINTQTLIFLKY